MKASFLWDSGGIDFVEPLALPRANPVELIASIPGPATG